MKKKIIVAGATVMLGMFGGCLQEVPLTSQEMDTVAEYAANKLLNSDANNVSRDVLYDEEEMEALFHPTATPIPNPTATPTPILEGNSSLGNSGNSQKTDPSPTEVPVFNNAEETNERLTKVLGAQDGIRIAYREFEVTDTVVSNEYFSLYAPKGRKYAIIYLDIYNDTEQEVIFDASAGKTEYSLDINLGSVSKSALSMLENDLQYLPITVPAKKSAEAVLVFDIEDVEITTAHLIIQNEKDETVFIKLK